MATAKREVSATRGVPVELDRTRYLRYPLATLISIQEQIEDGTIELKGAAFLRKLPELLLMGFRGDDPELTQEAVGQMVDGENLPAVVEAFQKAMGLEDVPEDAPAPAGKPAAKGKGRRKGQKKA